MRASFCALLCAVTFITVAPACGSSPCVSGAQVSCSCADGNKGAQTCKADGSGFDPCVCSSTGTTSSTTSTGSTTGGGAGGTGGNGGGASTTTSGTTGGGGSGGTACVPGAAISCYDGPPNTEGVGLCVSGTRTCKADGSDYGPCLGEVTPQAETCATPGDDDCNGKANEGGVGCSCAPNTQVPCYSGPPATEGVGACHGGTQTCNAQGTGYGVCVGEVTPQPETCNTPVDDNCNSMINEGGLGCVCTPNAIVPCYDGPQGTKDVGLCKGGTQTCNAQGTALGPCMGEVVPSTDLCATPVDEDCDGALMPCAGAQSWSKRFGAAGDQLGEAIAADAMANVMIGGEFKGNVDFGGGVLSSAAGSTDGYVAKFDQSGNHLWSKRFGDAAEQHVRAVAFDPAGNAIIAGDFAGSINFGGGALVSLGGTDAFVAKFDSAGNHLWSKRFGDAADQGATKIAITADGRIAVIGTCAGAIDFGLGAVPGTGPMFVAKLDPDGNGLWAKRFGTQGQLVQPSAVKFDDSSSVLVAGSFSGSLDFGGGPLLSNAGSEDVFLVKLEFLGGHIWSKRFGDSHNQQKALGLAVDSTNNIMLTGGFVGALDLGMGPLPGTNVDNTDNVFLGWFQSAGGNFWEKSFGDMSQQIGYDVASGLNDTVLVTGFAEGSVDFGGGALACAGGRDVFAAKFDKFGTYLGSHIYGDAADQYGFAIASDGAGGAFVTGHFASGINLGNGLLTSAGGFDIFLARISF
ncbi:MAG: hypothetical protein U0359_21845 [Byssovorax sp.]